MVKALRSAADTVANAGNPLPNIVLGETGQQVTPTARAACNAHQADAAPGAQSALADLLGRGCTLATGVVAGEIKLPIMRMHPSQKAAKVVHLNDLADYLDTIRAAAKRGAEQRYAGPANAGTSTLR